MQVFVYKDLVCVYTHKRVRAVAKRLKTMGCSERPGGDDSAPSPRTVRFVYRSTVSWLSKAVSWPEHQVAHYNWLTAQSDAQRCIGFVLGPVLLANYAGRRPVCYHLVGG